MTVTYSLHQGLRNKHPAVKRMSLPVLLAGAFLPDILDKPFSYAFNSPGRGISHSVFLVALVFYMLFRLLPKHRDTLIALLTGVALHLAEDMPYLHILLWPILGGWQFSHHYGFMESMRLYYLEFSMPGLLLAEVASYPFFLYYLFFRPKTVLEPELADGPPSA